MNTDHKVAINNDHLVLDQNEIANKYPNQIIFSTNQIIDKAQAMQWTYHFALYLNWGGDFFKELDKMDDAHNRIANTLWRLVSFHFQ